MTTSNMYTNATVIPVKHKTNRNTNTNVFVNNFINKLSTFFVKLKFKFLNWNTIKDDIDFVNKPLKPKPLGDKIVKITKLNIKMRI